MDKGDREGYLCVRGRVRNDLEALFELDSLKDYAGNIVETDSCDYLFRVYFKREDWVKAAADMAEKIDYSNFKSAVGRDQGPDRAHVYMEVWSALYELQT